MADLRQTQRGFIPDFLSPTIVVFFHFTLLATVVYGGDFPLGDSSVAEPKHLTSERYLEAPLPPIGAADFHPNRLRSEPREISHGVAATSRGLTFELPSQREVIPSAPPLGSSSPPEAVIIPTAQAKMATPSAQGHEPSPDVWRLEDFENFARQNNPTLAMSQARLEAARGLQLQARALPNPSIGYLGDEIGDEDTAGLQGMTLGFTIPNPRHRRAAMNSADWQVRQEAHLARLQTLRVLGEIRSRYIDAYVADRRVAAAEQIVAIAERIRDAVKQRYQAGEVSPAEVLQAQSACELARLSWYTEQSHAEGAWYALIYVAGTPHLPRKPLAPPVADEITPPDWAALENRILQESPEYLAAKAAVENARASLQAELSRRIPQVDVETIYKHHNTNGFNSVTVGVSLPVPIFDRNRGNILAAQAALREAQANLQRVELTLRQRLSQIRAEYSHAYFAVRTYRTVIIPHHRQLLELLHEDYKQGNVHLIDLLHAEQGLRQSELDFWSAYQVLLRCQAELDVLLAGIEAGLEWDR